MSAYKKPYLILFNAITDALKKIEQDNVFMAKQTLIQAQIDAEEEYISFENNSIEFLKIYNNDIK